MPEDLRTWVCRWRSARRRGIVADFLRGLCDAVRLARENERMGKAGIVPPTFPAPFQDRVHEWMQQCFTPAVTADKVERNHRFLEEALELVQSLGCTQAEAHMLVDYVFGRPAGECEQETGGVMVTLAAMANANSIRIRRAAETELTRCWSNIDVIRGKQAGKPRHSPLPGASVPPPVPVVWRAWDSCDGSSVSNGQWIYSTEPDTPGKYTSQKWEPLYSRPASAQPPGAGCGACDKPGEHCARPYGICVRAVQPPSAPLPRITSDLVQEWNGSIDLMERTNEGYQWTDHAYDFAALVRTGWTAVQRDAARYRWIRERSHADIAACWLVPGSVKVDGSPDGFDAAIDTARGAPSTVAGTDK